MGVYQTLDPSSKARWTTTHHGYAPTRQCYVLHRVTGAQWRLLPREYPHSKTVYHYFRQWRITGDWQRIHDTLRTVVRQRAGRHKHLTAGALDSQSIKTAHVTRQRGYDAFKHIMGRKRHVLVDTLGLLLMIVVTTAVVSDTAVASFFCND